MHIHMGKKGGDYDFILRNATKGKRRMKKGIYL